MIHEYKDGDIDFTEIIQDLKTDQKRKVRTKNTDILYRYQNEYSIKYKSNYRRLLWNTKIAMINNYTLSCKFIDFSTVDSFIDIGCGTGECIDYVLSNHKIDKVVGIDAVPNFINYAKKDNKNYNVEFITDNLFNIPNNNDIKTYDLCTMIGVLQTLDINSMDDIFNVVKEVVNSGGQLWITSVNYYKYIKHSFLSTDNRRLAGTWRHKVEELVYYIKDDFHDIKFGSFDKDGEIAESKYDGRYIFVYGIKN